MPEKIKETIEKIKEWWNKFTARQKGIIIGLALFAIAVFALIIFFVSRPKYKVLITAPNTKDASQIIDEVYKAASQWAKIAQECDVPSEMIAPIVSNMQL